MYRYAGLRYQYGTSAIHHTYGVVVLLSGRSNLSLDGERSGPSYGWNTATIDDYYSEE